MGLIGGLSALSGVIRGALLASSAVAILAAGMALDRVLPFVGANAYHRSAEAWKANARQWQGYGLAERAAFAKSEALRGREAAGAVVAVAEDQARCSARLSAARASSAAIGRITSAGPGVAAGACPERTLVDGADLKAAVSAP